MSHTKGHFPKISQKCFMSTTQKTNLFLFRKLFVFFGQDLGEIQVAHLGMDFCILGSLLHKEAKIGSEGFLWEVWMCLKQEVNA